MKEVLDRVTDDFKGKSAVFGWLESNKYPDGTEVAYVAAIQEYGAPEQGIPPRPFIGPTIQENQGEWLKITAQGITQVLQNKIKAEDVLRGVGLQAAGDIRKKISEIDSPALKEATIRARARKYADGKDITSSLTKPLIETGLMMDSCTNAVEGGS